MKRNILSNKLLQIGLISWAIIQIVPVGWQVLQTFKTSDEISRNLFSLPQTFYLGNYDLAQFAKYGLPLGVLFRNSLMITVLTLIVLVPITYVTAYVIAKFKIKGKNILIFVLIALIGIPMQSLVVPLYHLISKMNLNNRYLGLILPYAGYYCAFTTLLLQSFFREFPDELIEASKIDGCNHFQSFTKIVFPGSLGAISTVFIINFIQIWNEFILALVIMTKNESRTLPIGIVLYQGEWITEWGIVYAAIVMAIMPTIVIYLLFHRNIIKGVTSGAIKG